MTALHGVIPAGGTASVTGPTSQAVGLADALGLAHPAWRAELLPFAPELRTGAGRRY